MRRVRAGIVCGQRKRPSRQRGQRSSHTLHARFSVSRLTKSNHTLGLAVASENVDRIRVTLSVVNTSYYYNPLNQPYNSRYSQCDASPTEVSPTNRHKVPRVHEVWVRFSDRYVHPSGRMLFKSCKSMYLTKQTATYLYAVEHTCIMTFYPALKIYVADTCFYYTPKGGFHFNLLVHVEGCARV